ncbi:DedA family protein (plasmid) [Rhodobacteraceae bacterium SC52]|nr:DedA family protein [Rhodobacteraceae bacterium SC52]
MTDYVLGLIPEYGLYVVFIVVVLACLAAPLPASLLVLAAGSFSAAGDLVLWQVLAVTCLAFIIGDQLAFRIARTAGPSVLRLLRRDKKMAALVARSEALLQKRGGAAVLLSHTIVSPTCAYVSYLCGAGGMPYGMFSAYAGIGALLWSLAYVGLGYVFAGQLSQVSDVLSNFSGLVVAGVFVVGSIAWLIRRWKMREGSSAKPPRH